MLSLLAISLVKPRLAGCHYELCCLFFIDTFEGRFAVGAIVVSFLIMVAIYARKGFVRLIGISHIIVWVPLIAWIRLLLISGTPEGLFGQWLHAVIWLNGISLFLDGVDVIRYAMGNREPMSP